MIHVGEQVRITDTGKVYSTYPGFLDYYRQCGASSVTERVCSQYEFGREVTDEEAHDNVYTVMFIREHDRLEGRKLAIINDDNGTFIIEIQYRENTSWQGKVKWVDRDREQYFRSALELFKMIEHALDEEEKISQK